MEFDNVEFDELVFDSMSPPLFPLSFASWLAALGIAALTNEFSGLEVLAKERFPVMNDYLNSINSSIKEIDNSLDKQDDIFKGIKVGLSCLTRKG